MVFGLHYEDWNRKRIKAIIDYYGVPFFKDKKILDLGCGHGDVAGAFSRLGANVTCVDARQENLNILKTKYPELNILKVNLEHEWPFNSKYDIVFSLALTCHLTDYSA